MQETNVNWNRSSYCRRMSHFINFLARNIVCHLLYYRLFILWFRTRIYATPSTDTAIANAPLEKVGVAAGIYKMASALGGAFGVALSGAVYAIVSNMTNIYTGAMIALMVKCRYGNIIIRYHFVTCA